MKLNFTSKSGFAFFFFHIEKNILLIFFNMKKNNSNPESNAPQKITQNTFFNFDFRQKFAAALHFILWRNVGYSGREFGPFLGSQGPILADFGHFGPDFGFQPKSFAKCVHNGHLKRLSKFGTERSKTERVVKICGDCHL